VIFMESIGNTAFNSVWEGCLPTAVIHPKDLPLSAALREGYIRRKYVNREFMAQFHPVRPSTTNALGIRGWVEKLGGKQPKLVEIIFLKP